MLFCRSAVDQLYRTSECPVTWWMGSKGKYLLIQTKPSHDQIHASMSESSPCRGGSSKNGLLHCKMYTQAAWMSADGHGASSPGA